MFGTSTSIVVKSLSTSLEVSQTSSHNKQRALTTTHFSLKPLPSALVPRLPYLATESRRVPIEPIANR
jgi:hypothetical protein